MKKTLIEENYVQDANEERDGGQPTNVEEGPNTKSSGGQSIGNGKLTGYKSEYFDSSDRSSNDDTSHESNADDAKRQKSRDNYYDHYDPNAPLQDFYLCYT